MGSGPACQDIVDSILGSQHCLPTAPLVCQPQHCKVCDQLYLLAWGPARATSKQPLLSHLILSLRFLARSKSHLALPGLPQPRLVAFKRRGLQKSRLLPCCCGQHSTCGSSESHQRFCSHLPPISPQAIFHDCRAGYNQPGWLQTLNFPVLAEYCQCCFRWWLCKHPAGRATQNIAHRSILFPSMCSLCHLPSSC